MSKIDQKCTEIIKDRLRNICQISEINRQKGVHKSIIFVDWSAGSVEVDHYYEINCVNDTYYFCIITSILNIWVIRVRFFKKIDGKYKYTSL